MPDVILIVLAVTALAVFVVYGIVMIADGLDKTSYKYTCLFLATITSVLISWSIAYLCCDLRYDNATEIKVYFTSCGTKQYCVYDDEIIDLTKLWGSIHDGDYVLIKEVSRYYCGVLKLGPNYGDGTIDINDDVNEIKLIKIERITNE